MSKPFPKSEANRVLVDWARNMRRGYANTGYASLDYDRFVYGGGSVPVLEDYSFEEKLCLNEMMILRVAEPDLYRVAMLEYIKQAFWLADCREHGGWVDKDTRTFHRVEKPQRSDFLRFVRADYNIQKNQYYNRLNRLQRRIYERVIA